jgi:hypothetical protein
MITTRRNMLLPLPAVPPTRILIMLEALRSAYDGTFRVQAPDTDPRAPANPPGPPQLSASAPAADHFQTAQSPPGPYDDTLPIDNSH